MPTLGLAAEIREAITKCRNPTSNRYKDENDYKEHALQRTRVIFPASLLWVFLCCGCAVKHGAKALNDRAKKRRLLRHQSRLPHVSSTHSFLERQRPDSNSNVETIRLQMSMNLENCSSISAGSNTSIFTLNHVVQPARSISHFFRVTSWRLL